MYSIIWKSTYIEKYPITHKWSFILSYSNVVCTYAHRFSAYSSYNRCNRKLSYYAFLFLILVFIQVFKVFSFSKFELMGISFIIQYIFKNDFKVSSWCAACQNLVNIKLSYNYTFLSKSYSFPYHYTFLSKLYSFPYQNQLLFFVQSLVCIGFC